MIVRSIITILLYTVLPMTFLCIGEYFLVKLNWFRKFRKITIEYLDGTYKNKAKVIQFEHSDSQLPVKKAANDY